MDAGASHLALVMVLLALTQVVPLWIHDSVTKLPIPQPLTNSWVLQTLITWQTLPLLLRTGLPDQRDAIASWWHMGQLQSRNTTPDCVICTPKRVQSCEL